MLKKIKKLSKTRTLTLPKDIAFEAGLMAGQAVDITQTQGGIFIATHVPVCRFCGSLEAKTVLDIEICAECAAKLQAGAENE